MYSINSEHENAFCFSPNREIGGVPLFVVVFCMNERIPSEPTPPIAVEYRIYEDGVETVYLPSKPKQQIRRHVVLFLLTLLTTTLAGAYGDGPWFMQMARGLTFSIPLLTILLFHEFGHYLMARKYGVDVTLPYFIPGLPFLIGTFGAVIKMRSPLRSKNALFDIGVAGPLAGVAVAIPVIIVGLLFSEVRLISSEGGDFALGSSLLFWLLAKIMVAAVPANHDIVLHQTAFAGWVGLLVTMLNLLPVGQLDGGHVTYAIFGRIRHGWIGKIVLPLLLLFGLLPLPQIVYILMYDTPATGIINDMARYGWLGWLLWFAILKYLIKPTHPPVMDEAQPLDRRRVLIGWLALLIFVLTFTPAPFITNF